MSLVPHPAKRGPGAGGSPTLLALAIAVIVGACVAGQTGAVGASGPTLALPSASSSETTAATAGSPRPSSSATGNPTSGSDGIGVRRAAVMQAIDAAVAPAPFDWGKESTMRDGTPKVEGSSFETIAGVSILGPPEDIIAVQVSGLAVTSPEEARIALAALRAAVPEAEAWWRGTFDGPPDFQTRDFEGTSVGWTRSTFLFDADQSALFIAPTALMPTPTPTSTPRPTPPPRPDLLAYLPSEADGVPLVATRRTVASLPDDDRCQPVCRWQVQAFAHALGVEESAIDVVTAEPGGNTESPIDLAVIRVRSTQAPFLFVSWEAALKGQWPELFRDAEDLGDGRLYEVLRQRQTAIDEIATAWYVRDLGDTLVIVSDGAAQAWGYAPRRRVTALLEALPTPQ